MNCKHDKRSNRGQMLVAAFAISVVLVVSVGTLVYISQKEQKKVQSAEESTIAMKIAEKGLSKAVWKLKERVQNWDILMAGGYLTDYNFDKKYVEGDGEYAIKIEKATSTNTYLADTQSRVVVTAVGREKKSGEVRTLKVVYRNTSENPDYSFQQTHNKTHTNTGNSLPDPTPPAIGSGEKKLGVGVHWGPVCSPTDLEVKNESGSGLNNTFWNNSPRKFAVQEIKGTNPPFYDQDPSLPNTDNVEWWSYNTAVPTTPKMDYAYYKTIAQSNGSYNGVQIFAGGGEYHTTGTGLGCTPSHGGSSSSMHTILNRIDSAPRCYFFDNDIKCELKGSSFFWGTIVAKNTTVNMGNQEVAIKDPTAVSQGSYSTTVPPNAWKEYAKIDTTLTGEYPGDGGLRTVTPTYTFSGDNKVYVRGYIWSDGRVRLTDKAVVHGVIVSYKDLSLDGGGSCQLFYDPTLLSKSTQVSLTLETYNEVKAGWPAGL